MLGVGRLSPETASLGPHSHPETGSCSQVGSPRIQTIEASHSTARGYRLMDRKKKSEPAAPVKQ